jgi:hypothetical protein
MLAGKTMDVVEVGTVGGTMISGAAKGESTPEKEFLPNLQGRPTHQQYPIVKSNPITAMMLFTHMLLLLLSSGKNVWSCFE